VPDTTVGSLQERVEQMLDRLDAMDIDGVSAMLTDDTQSVDEISRGWTRGRAAAEAFMADLKDSVSDVQSRMSDARESRWGDVGLVTCVLDQTYTLDGERQSVSAPASIVLRHEDGDWKVALFHSVPLPEQP
jgi:ketosteroid isomerase-like protein